MGQGRHADRAGRRFRLPPAGRHRAGRARSAAASARRRPSRTSRPRKRPSKATRPILRCRSSNSTAPTTLMKKGAGTIEARDQASAALKQSNAALERDQALAQAAERQIDLAKANIESAEEALKLAKIVLDYTVLAAPFDGVIMVRQAELGEIMVPGTPVRDPGRSRSRLAARLHQRDRHRQDPPRPDRDGHDRHLSGQELPGPHLLHLLRTPSSRRRASKPMPSASRSSIASGSTSTIRRTSWCRACRPMRCSRRLPPGQS